MTVLIREFDVVPEILPENVSVLRFPARNRRNNYYKERTDRNIGWITPTEQEILRNSVVGIAGTGGMGGLLAAMLTRLGVGEIRIADTETFDISNINRQFAAMRTTIGKSKALETARLIREISDDVTLVVYPEGITPSTVDSFLEGCSVVCDEVEFWAVGSRILLHQRSLSKGIALFNCNTVGFATHLFLFRPEDPSIEDLFRFSYEEAYELETKIQKGTASQEETERVMEAMLRILVPTLPEYCTDESEYKTEGAVRKRLMLENRASIIATNPPFATGLIGNHVLLYLVRNSPIRRKTILLPAPPGYLFLDGCLLEARLVHK
jgi:molybdopterin/thiamine biosynthesis adenylyltransferase